METPGRSDAVQRVNGSVTGVTAVRNARCITHQKTLAAVCLSAMPLQVIAVTRCQASDRSYMRTKPAGVLCRNTACQRPDFLVLRNIFSSKVMGVPFSNVQMMPKETIGRLA